MNIVQQFVEPKKQHNFIIKCEWTRLSACHEMQIQVMTNVTNIQSPMLNLDARCATFEGGHVTASSCPPELRSDLFRCCKEVEKHVSKHAVVCIASANLYFKVDPQNTIYLVYATCIKADKINPCLNGHRNVILGLLNPHSQPKIKISKLTLADFKQLDVDSDDSDKPKKTGFTVMGRIETGKELSGPETVSKKLEF